jgi:hypothetical protein
MRFIYSLVDKHDILQLNFYFLIIIDIAFILFLAYLFAFVRVVARLIGAVAGIG